MKSTSHTLLLDSIQGHCLTSELVRSRFTIHARDRRIVKSYGYLGK